jgi:hypothetical protein
LSQVFLRQRVEVETQLFINFTLDFVTAQIPGEALCQNFHHFLDLSHLRGMPS